MPRHEFEIVVVTQEMEHGILLAAAPSFPEISRCGDDRERLLEALAEAARRLVEDDEPLDRSRRRAGGTPEVGEVTVELEPPPRGVAWREPVALRFATVRWSQGDSAHVAAVPALGIEVLASRPDELERLIPAHIRSALRRTKAATSLKRLVALQRCRWVQVDRTSFGAEILTPKQVALEDQQGEQVLRPVLRSVGTDLTAAPFPPVFGRDAVVDRVAEALTGKRPRSVLLVGPAGVGKTAAVREVVRRRYQFGLGQTPFWATGGARLVAGMSGYGIWQERCRDLLREVVATRAILHLGHLVELMEVGKAEGQAQGIAAFLRPAIARGDLRVVAECLPEQLPVIERDDPHLLDAFAIVRVEEPSAEEGRAILARSAQALRPGVAAALAPEALETLDRLHRRYATGSVYPGRPLRFLTDLLNDRPPNSGPPAAEDVTRAFARETGLPLMLLEDSVRLDLEGARRWFAARVLGQSEAVDLVVDLLATIKAGLTRPGRPIASLLLIGPTGVGKTELAKALAEFLFGDARRLTRLDMSEYADPRAVQRLIGGPLGSAEGVLTAKIREQPFAVVLLDEFEKADPLFFDLLLQVLGEGRLTDAAGRLADFRNAVIIMTSNLGAESYRRGSSGFHPGGRARGTARDHFDREVQVAVRPELFNRIDRIVPFAPLDQATTLGIARRQLELLEGRDGLRFRKVRLSVAPGVAAALARAGFDPRYGARPLKRAIERELLAPLAEAMNGYAADAALDVDVGREGDRPRVAVRARRDEAGRTVATTPRADRAAVAEACLDLRRRWQRLRRSPAARELFNEITRLRQAQERRARRARSAVIVEHSPRLAALTRVADALETLGRQAEALEDDAMLGLLGEAPWDRAPLEARRSEIEHAWLAVLAALHRIQFPNPDAVTLVVFGGRPGALFDLVRAYQALAVAGRAEVTVWQLPERPPDQAPAWKGVERPGEFLARARAGLLGIGLEVRGPDVFARLGPETGLHQFIGGGRRETCRVETTEGRVFDHPLPEGLGQPGFPDGMPRRVYWSDQDKVEDTPLARKFEGPVRDLATLLARIVDYRLQKEIESLVGP